MEMPATASSRTSIDRSSRVGWMACMALWVGSTITGSSSNRVWMILSTCSSMAHHRRDRIRCSAMAPGVAAVPAQP